MILWFWVFFVQHFIRISGTVCGKNTVFSNYRRPRGGNHLLFQDAQQDSINPDSLDLPSGRIINGNLAKPGAWTWQVSVQLTNPKLGFVGHWCGGTLVDQDWVITAAHCVQNKIVEVLGGGIWNVVLGEYDRKKIEGKEIRMVIDDIIIHPNFTEYQHDIAMLRLPFSVKTLNPICLPEPEHVTGLMCIATGWGQTVENGTLENRLHQATMRVLDNRSCAEMYKIKYGINIQEGHVCAGSPSGSVDRSTGACVGDSGGPLQCNMKDGLWYMVGLTSFGSGCAKPGFPDVFMRISHYKKWIEEIIQQYKLD